MRSRSRELLGLLVVTGRLWAGEPGQAPVPTARDVVDSVCASLARYHSISCRLVTSNWGSVPLPAGEGPRPAPNDTSVTIRRSSRGTRAYTETRHGEGRLQGNTILAACSNGVTKTCRWGESNHPEGTVSRSGDDPGEVLDPLATLKTAPSYLTGDLPVSLTVTAEGMYRLETVRELEDKTATTAWTVDPAHDYVPVEISITVVSKTGSTPSGFSNLDCVSLSNVMRFERMAMTAAGLFFPTRITLATATERPGQQGKREVVGWSETVIEDLLLNSDMPDELFQFRFPNGTHVEDQIANLRYVEGTDEQPIDGWTDRVPKPEQKSQQPAGADPAKGGPAQPYRRRNHEQMRDHSLGVGLTLLQAIPEATLFS